MIELESLYHAHGPALLSYLRRLGGGEAEDLLHDTFVRALQHPGRLAAAGSQRAWLFGVAHHVAVAALRRKRKVKPLPPGLPADESPVDARLELMAKAIQKLPPLHQEVLNLRLVGGLSYEEIAGALGVPLGTVRSRLHHAVHQLRQLVPMRQASEESI